MSRSGYNDDIDQWDLIRWRGAVASAIRGKRGQAFLREMLAAMDALPEKKLIAHELVEDGHVCALGSVGRARGIDMTDVDPEDHKAVAYKFGIPHAMACEVMEENDNGFPYWSFPFGHKETAEQRFVRVRNWIEQRIVASKAGTSP